MIVAPTNATPNKVVFAASQEQLMRSVGMQAVTVFDDRWAIKSASATGGFDKDVLRSMAPPKGMFGVHAILVGDYETYGFNRNGDAFDKAANQKYHPTFVSHGAMFREHLNRKPEHRIGHTKLSCHNGLAHRVELWMWGDREKAADMYEFVKAGGETSFSMSCRVPYDECSICGHQAKNQSLYCDHLRNHMGQWMPGHQKYAFAKNPHPTFFDASWVRKPADRIAHYIRYMEPELIEKAAGASAPILPGFELAVREGLYVPEDYLHNDSSFTAPLLKCASIIDEQRRVNPGKLRTLLSTVKQAFAHELSDDEVEKLASVRPGRFFRKMASGNAILPFLSFAALVTGTKPSVLSKDASFCEACSRLPEILSYPEKFPVQQLSHLFEPEAESTASCGRDGIDSMMQEVSQRFCCNPSAAGRRALTITITITKAAATNGNVDSDAVARMLSSYAAYKSAALRAIRSIHGDDEADKTSFVAGVLTRIYS